MSIPVTIICEKCGKKTAEYAISSSKKIIYTCTECGHDTIIKKETGAEPIPVEE